MANDDHPIKEIIAELDNNSDSYSDVTQLCSVIKNGLRNPREGEIPFQVPQISEDESAAFVMALRANEWFLNNACIVIFGDTSHRILGIGRAEDISYFQSQSGREHLKTDQVNVYSVSEYSEIFLRAYFLRKSFGDDVKNTLN